MTSLLLWHMLTSSFGWTGRPPPAIWAALVAITSLAFMLVDVPEPVWKMSIGNSASQRPSTTSWAARTISDARSSGNNPRSRLASAAACLISPSARMNEREKVMPLIGKFSTARAVVAP